MVATEAAMVVDMGAMVDMAAATAVATAVTEAMVVVIVAEIHPNMHLTIYTVPYSWLYAAWWFAEEDVQQHMELPTQWTNWNAIIVQKRHGNTVKLRNQI